MLINKSTQMKISSLRSSFTLIGKAFDSTKTDFLLLLLRRVSKSIDVGRGARPRKISVEIRSRKIFFSSKFSKTFSSRVETSLRFERSSNRRRLDAEVSRWINKMKKVEVGRPVEFGFDSLRSTRLSIFALFQRIFRFDRMDEQKFLSTLQDCLQPDNDKRVAAEVRRLRRRRKVANTVRLALGSLSRNPRRTKNRFTHVNFTKHCVRNAGESNRSLVFTRRSFA